MANAIYLNLGTAVNWLVSGGDEAMDLGAASGNAGAVTLGSYHDWGADPRPHLYYAILDVDGFDTAPVIGETVDVYITESDDATLWTGPEAPSNTVSSTGNTDRLKNLLYCFSAVVRSTTAGNNLTARGYFSSPARYWAPAIHNNTADKLLSTADAHRFRVFPVYDEVQ